MQKRKNEKMPLGWGQGADGVSSEDPRDVTDRGGCLQPLGGPEITGTLSFFFNFCSAITYDMADLLLHNKVYPDENMFRFAFATFW